MNLLHIKSGLISLRLNAIHPHVRQLVSVTYLPNNVKHHVAYQLRRFGFAKLHETRRVDRQFHTSSCACKDPLKTGHDFYERVTTQLSRLEEKRIYGYSTLKVCAFAIFFLGLVLFISWEVIRDNVADEVSTVATRTLSDKELQMKTRELTIELLHTIFQSKDIQREAVKFLEGVLQYQETQTALTSLLVKVISRKDTLHHLTRLLKDAINQSMSDPEFRTELARNLKLLLSDKHTKQAVLEILFYVLSDPEILEATRVFVQEVLASNRVQTEAAKLGKRVLDDVVSDPSTQKHTGDALWNVFQYSVTPVPSRWFKSSKDQKNKGNIQMAKRDEKEREKEEQDLNDMKNEVEIYNEESDKKE